MKRILVAASVVAIMLTPRPVWADGEAVDGSAQTTADAIRVVIVRSGQQDSIGTVTGGSSSDQGCAWNAIKAEFMNLGDHIKVPTGDSDLAETLYVLFCNGDFHSTVWVAPEDIVDLDAVVASEAQRYVEEVLAPDVSIGVNPSTAGLVGLASWFWIDGFSGSVTAPPIEAFGMSVDVRLATGSVTWDFGDGTIVEGDLGQAYPAESSVQHIHQTAGDYLVEATLDLVPEYRVNGGPWLTLPNLSVTADADIVVEERQAVIVNR